MTTPPVDEPEPPRGGTPLDDALAPNPDRDAGADADDDDDDTDRGDDPTTETEEDPRYA
jgi:hypothetical protein